MNDEFRKENYEGEANMSESQRSGTNNKFCFADCPSIRPAKSAAQTLVALRLNLLARNSKASAKSDADFINKLEGCLQEADETAWLELLVKSDIVPEQTRIPSQGDGRDRHPCYDCYKSKERIENMKYEFGIMK
jgi:hypothetical protein